MIKPYLLGFVRDCFRPPMFAGQPTNLTRVGRFGILWCGAEQAVPLNRETFLAAHLEFYKSVCENRLAFLPFPAGVRVRQEENLTELIAKYLEDLERCFYKIEGCAEYLLNITYDDPEFNAQLASIPSHPVQDGKGYIEWLRRHKQLKDAQTQRAHKIREQLQRHLGDWVKNDRMEVPAKYPRFELYFLVPYIYQEIFCQKLNAALENGDFSVQLTGPWPPFHFAGMTIQPESFLIRDPVNFYGGGVKE